MSHKCCQCFSLNVTEILTTPYLNVHWSVPCSRPHNSRPETVGDLKFGIDVQKAFSSTCAERPQPPRHNHNKKIAGSSNFTIPSICRDWHGVAEKAGLSGELIRSLANDPDPTGKVLKMWSDTWKSEATISKLIGYLEDLDRLDVVDDVLPLIADDLRFFQENLANGKTVAAFDLDLDKHILTRDDVFRMQEGLEPQLYDAFVLFDDDDIAFATEIIDNMEKNHDMKFCIKERDLVAGGSEHDAVIKLIAERCARLIVVISPAFLESNANKFFYSVAQSISIEQRQRKIIPCIYKDCGKLPPELDCYFKLDFRRSGALWNFWEKLRDSIVKSGPGPFGLGAPVGAGALPYWVRNLKSPAVSGWELGGLEQARSFSQISNGFKDERKLFEGEEKSFFGCLVALVVPSMLSWKLWQHGCQSSSRQLLLGRSYEVWNKWPTNGSLIATADISAQSSLKSISRSASNSDQSLASTGLKSVSFGSASLNNLPEAPASAPDSASINGLLDHSSRKNSLLQRIKSSLTPKSRANPVTRPEELALKSGPDEIGPADANNAKPLKKKKKKISFRLQKKKKAVLADTG
ncbi:hypothetical protein HUJ05_010964 [Dendroctonus ponderosae]|nr:hypothetical protein HUJ05_010964 [Dendroctonus ponderosae]